MRDSPRASCGRGTGSPCSRGGPAGWLAIAPPAVAFDWIDARAIRDQTADRAIVVDARASVRSGCPGARMPGPPRPALDKGTVVRRVDRPDLTTGRGPKATTWRAIAPPEGEVRYVRADGIRLDASPPQPTIDPQVQQAQGGRPVGPDEAIRKFEEALRRSRKIDDDVAQVKQRLADARTITERGYDAKGLLQASSREVEGQKVHALIGPEGVPIAYLAIPPGIPAARFLARKVGVRGNVHFNESLRARLITVQDLDPLDKPR